MQRGRGGGDGSPARDPARAIVHQRVGAEQEEQEHALEHRCRGARQAERDLRCLAADIGERQQEPCEDDPARMQPADDAERIDTTELDVGDVVDRIERLVRARVA